MREYTYSSSGALGTYGITKVMRTQLLTYEEAISSDSGPARVINVNANVNNYIVGNNGYYGIRPL